MNLLPIFTALIAVALLGEQLQVFHLVGGGLTLCGILLAQMMQNRFNGANEINSHSTHFKCILLTIKSLNSVFV